MSFEIRILQLADRDALLQYERQKLFSLEDEIERQMIEWQAPWRVEAMEHYLPLGWSFGLWVGGQLRGYFLAQTQVFTRGWTQSLWLEHLQSESNEITGALLEVAYKLCREKHFQRLFLAKSIAVDAALLEKSTGPYSETLLKVEPSSDGVYALKTSKA